MQELYSILICSYIFLQFLHLLKEMFHIVKVVLTLQRLFYSSFSSSSSIISKPFPTCPSFHLFLVLPTTIHPFYVQFLSRLYAYSGEEPICRRAINYFVNYFLLSTASCLLPLLFMQI